MRCLIPQNQWRCKNMRKFLALTLIWSIAFAGVTQAQTNKHQAGVRLKTPELVRKFYFQDVAHELWHEKKRRIHAQQRRAAARAAAKAQRAAERAAAQAQQYTPAPTTTPTASSPPVITPSYSGSGYLSEEQVAAYARAAGFPESVIPTMVAIAKHESGLCPTAVYGYGCAGAGHAYAGGPACGLWQLYSCPGSEYLNPAVNAAGAYQKYKHAGYSLSPWRGAY